MLLCDPQTSKELALIMGGGNAGTGTRCNIPTWTGQGPVHYEGKVQGTPSRSCPTTGHSQMMWNYAGGVVTAAEVLLLIRFLFLIRFLLLIRFTIACFLPCHQRRSHTCRSMVPRACFALCVIELLFWSIWAIQSSLYALELWRTCKLEKSIVILTALVRQRVHHTLRGYADPG